MEFRPAIPAACLIAVLTVHGGGTGASSLLHAREWEAPRPLVITSGGIYAGRWGSNDPDIPAVTISTTDPVVLEDCSLSGVGTLVSTRHGPPEDREDGVTPLNTDGVDLTVRNCVVSGARPRIDGRAGPRFVVALNPARVAIHHNTIEGTRGIWIYAEPDRPPARDIKVRHNLARNIDGRCYGPCSDRNIGAWVSETGIAVANFVQITDIHEAGRVDVSWNLVRNEPGASAVEDMINLFQVRGTPQRPVTVADNMLIGAFPGHDAFTGAYSGSGIMVDGRDEDALSTSAWIEVSRNRVLFASNAGIGIAAGNNVRAPHNVIIRPHRYPDGNVIRTKAVGVFVWQCCQEDGRDRAAYFNNAAHSNSIFVSSYNGREFHMNNSWTPDCATDGKGGDLCIGNVALPEMPAEMVEKQELTRWMKELEAVGGTVGARPRDTQP